MCASCLPLCQVLRLWSSSSRQEGQDGSSRGHVSSCAHMQQIYTFLAREAAFDAAGYKATLDAFNNGRLVWLPDEQADSAEQQVPGSFHGCQVLRYADPAGLLLKLPPGLVPLRELAGAYPALQHFFCRQLRELPKQ
jgi:hypothetical protein